MIGDRAAQPVATEVDMSTPMVYAGRMRIIIDLDPSEYLSLTTPKLFSLLNEPTVFDTVDTVDSLSLTPEQRRTLFGLFTDVFGVRDREARRAFTRRVLDTTSDDVSWSSKSDYSITQAEADKLIDWLATAKAVFDLV